MDPQDDLTTPSAALKRAAVALTLCPEDEGSQRALCREVYLSLRGDLLRQARRLLAWWGGGDVEDLLHDTLYALFRKAVRLCRSRRLDVAQSPDAIAAYFRKIAINELRDQYRKWARGATHRFLPLPLDAKQLADRDGNATPSLEMREVLARLPATDRRVIEMRVYEGRSYLEIGENLSVSAGHARVRFARAVRKLRRLLELGAAD